MNRLQYFSTTLIAVFVLFAGAMGAAPKKANHHNGKQLVGEKIKTNGKHVIDKKGAFTTSVEVKDGKIAGLHVNHAQKGEVPVKKYKSDKKMAQADRRVSL